MATFLVFLETVINGLMTGVLYSLVALGFVLIFKASGIFNFAQGVMALFAALTFVGFLQGDVPFGPVLHELESARLPGWLFVVLLASLCLALGRFAMKATRLSEVNTAPGWQILGTGAFAAALYAVFALGFGSALEMALIVTVSLALGAILLVLMGRPVMRRGVWASYLEPALAGAAVLAFFKFVAPHAFGHELPVWAALMLAILVMTGLAFVVVRIVLRPLVNQEPIILFMATIGLAFVLEGFGDMIWGSDVKSFDIQVGLPQGAFFDVEDFTRSLVPNADEVGYWGMFILKLDVVAAVVAAVLVTTLALFFQYTKTGRALRAVADDHQAALSVGISLTTIWVIVWAVAGYVALAAGIMWGAPSGIQFSLSLIALKALPVLMLGGFTSVPGAIVGGLIVGVGEKIAEIYTGFWMNSAFGFSADYFTGIQSWFAYMLALLFLLFRPQGLFGEKIIERV